MKLTEVVMSVPTAQTCSAYPRQLMSALRDAGRGMSACVVQVALVSE